MPLDWDQVNATTLNVVAAKLDLVFKPSPLFTYLRMSRGASAGDLVANDSGQVFGVAASDARAGEIATVQVQGVAKVTMPPAVPPVEYARNISFVD